MSDKLKQKTAISLLWNAIDKIGFQVVAFLIGIITARLLSPKDFGLIGALALFSIIGNLLIESGFSQALIRRETNTQRDYNTVFYFNLLLSIALYTVLWFCAPLIAEYFRMPELTLLSRVLFLTLIINSLSLIQTVNLTKTLSFQKIAVANITSIVISGILSVIMAIYGYAYWAIACQQLSQVAIRTLMLWLTSKWRPTLEIELSTLQELMHFSLFLLVTSLINAIVRYIYNFIIGRNYTVQDLGYYSQGQKFQLIPVTIISSTIGGVAYPVLSQLKTDRQRQLQYVRKLTRITAFLIFPAMLGFIAIADQFIELFLSAKWLPSSPYFKLLLVAGITSPFINLTLSTLLANGQPKLNFRLEVIRNILTIGSIFICSSSIIHMLWGYVIANFIAFIVNVIVQSKQLTYKLSDYLKDIIPYLSLSMLMYIVVLFIGKINMPLLLTFIFQVSAGSIIYLGISYFLGSQVIRDVLNLIKKKPIID